MSMTKVWKIKVKMENSKKAEYTFDDAKLIAHTSNLNGITAFDLVRLGEMVNLAYTWLRDNGGVSLEAKEEST